MGLCRYARRVSCAALASVSAFAVATTALAHEGGVTGRIGEARFEVSCTPEAQATFNRAVALLHSFWFTPARNAFQEVAKQDPGCAMAHWGVAMVARGNPLAAAPSAKAMADGLAAIERAQSVGGKTQRERDYIEALALFYRDYDKKDHRTRVLAHEEAMARLASAYPEDREARMFYALALNISASPTDKTYANQLKAGKLLEAVFADQPQHPGVAHYLIHTYDYPPIANQGLGAAKRYAAIAPDSPHALHMPSHVFTRLGHWEDSVSSNRASAEIAKKELASPDPKLMAPEALHAYDYMVYAHLQLGQEDGARRAVDEIRAGDKVDAGNHLAASFALAAMPARYALERHRWDEAARLEVPKVTGFSWEAYPQSEAIVHFARALGAARSGDVATAKAAVERLKQLHDALVGMKQGYWAGQVGIQGKAAAAWIALAEGRKDEALALMREAADLESATEKHIVTPGPIVPARELLGFMLLETGQPARALVEFEKSQAVEPNRFHGFAGAARAAELSGEREKAKANYAKLLEVSAKADAERPVVQTARAFLGR
jgi:tetratricopeptide (TPR) repeat protein